MSQLDEVELSLDELEALRLADLEGHYQDAAASRMGVSRATFGRIVEAARRKVAEALVKGKALKIGGGVVTWTGPRVFECEDCGRVWSLPLGTGAPVACAFCASEKFHRTDSGPVGRQSTKAGGGKALLLAFALLLSSGACQRDPVSGPALAVALAQFDDARGGAPVPEPASVGFLAIDGRRWRHGSLTDPDSNVFHKVFEYCPVPDRCGLVSVAGTAAMLKIWPREGAPGLLWKVDFGGRFSRLRDAEVADILGDGVPTLVVGTHDQGVVALARPGPAGYEVTELDREPDTFVHEIEVGDLDGDGTFEIYATPSQPNKLDGSVQRGAVVRYVPARREGRRVVADLDDRHAKEILVTDLDGDGRDELYVAVEAVSGGNVEIRRYLADTSPEGGTVLAVLPDQLCRCLTAGDLDGDGRREIVAALRRNGLWMLRPTGDDAWERRLLADDSSAFEHAALLADFDGDRRDELYVASDDQHEVRRYRWRDGAALEHDVLYRYPEGMSQFTWSLTRVPAARVPAAAWEP